MNALGTFLAGPIGSVLRVFAGAVLVTFLADLQGAVTVDFTRWQTYLVAGLAAAVPVAIAWVNPADTRFGRGA